MNQLDMPVVGYRMWFWRNGKLRSAYANNVWTRGENIATCQVWDDVIPCEHAPAPECRCGLHAYTSTDHAVWASVCHEAEYSPVTAWCVGAVLLYGLVLAGPNILRASHGEVLAFVTNGRGMEAAVGMNLPALRDARLLRAYALDHGNELHEDDAECQ